MTIEVIRIIRYRYDTVERMTKDMQRWTIQSPPVAGNMSFTSSHLPPIVVEDPVPEAVADAIEILRPTGPTHLFDRPRLTPVCRIPACGCDGEAHP